MFFPMPGTKLTERALREGWLSYPRYRAIVRGNMDRASWHRESLLDGPCASYAYRWKVALPIVAKLPMLAMLVQKNRSKTITSVLFYLSMLFVDQHEFMQKMKDYVSISICFFSKRTIKV